MCHSRIISHFPARHYAASTAPPHHFLPIQHGIFYTRPQYMFYPAATEYNYRSPENTYLTYRFFNPANINTFPDNRVKKFQSQGESIGLNTKDNFILKDSLIKSDSPSPVVQHLMDSAVGRINITGPIHIKPVAKPGSEEEAQQSIPDPLSPRDGLISRYSTPIFVPNQVVSHYRAQDANGGYQFSYSDGSSTRVEERDHRGRVRGSYSFQEPTGEIRQYYYIADEAGFRVVGSGLPEQRSLSSQIHYNDAMDETPPNLSVNIPPPAGIPNVQFQNELMFGNSHLESKSTDHSEITVPDEGTSAFNYFYRKPAATEVQFENISNQPTFGTTTTSWDVAPVFSPEVNKIPTE